MVNAKISEKFGSVRGEKNYKITQIIESAQKLTSESLEGFDPAEMIATKKGMQIVTELLRSYVEQCAMKFDRLKAEFESTDQYDSLENNTEPKSKKVRPSSESVRTGKRGRPANQPGTNKYCVLRAVEEKGPITISEIRKVAQNLGKEYSKDITANQVKQTVNSLVSQKIIQNKSGKYSVI